MKAVIVECSNSAAVALCDDGSFRKLKNKGYSIGQELLLRQNRSANHMMQKLSICASLALVLLSFVGIGSHSYVEPYSYVSLDINPSIEYALNRYDKVISVSGINNEGQQVVSSIESDIKNQNITTALGVTIGQLEKDNYIVQEEKNHVIVSVCSNNDTKTRSLTSCIDTFSVEKSSVCLIDTVPVSKEVKDDADSLGITPGKLALIQAVAETTSDSDFDVSEWTDKTVSELETTIQQASSQSPDEQDKTSVNVVNSEYLSSVLDDNAANKSDSTATVSTNGNETEPGSTLTDNETNTTNDLPAGIGEGVSPSKPQTGDTTTPAAAGSTTNKTDSSGATDTDHKSDPKPDDKSDASDSVPTDNGSTSADDTEQANPGITDTPDEDTSSFKSDINKDHIDHNKDNTENTDSEQTGTSPSKDSESSMKDNTAPEESTSKEDASTGTSSKKDTDTLTESSSSKKNPYPDSITDVLEESTNENPIDGGPLDLPGEEDISPES